MAAADVGRRVTVTAGVVNAVNQHALQRLHRVLRAHTQHRLWPVGTVVKAGFRPTRLLVQARPTTHSARPCRGHSRIRQ
jgi:hypothetical protein